MKVHASYELLTDDGKPVPQGVRLIDIQNDDLVVTFVGIAIDEHGQPLIQLIDHDAPGSGLVRLHAENAERLRFVTASTSEPAPAGVTHAPTIDDVSGEPRDDYQKVRELMMELSKRYHNHRFGLPESLRHFIHYALQFGDVKTLDAARAALDTLTPNLEDDIPF